MLNRWRHIFEINKHATAALSTEPMRDDLVSKLICFQLRIASVLEFNVLDLGVDEVVAAFGTDGAVAAVYFAGAFGGQSLWERGGVLDGAAVAVAFVGLWGGCRHYWDVQVGEEAWRDCEIKRIHLGQHALF